MKRKRFVPTVLLLMMAVAATGLAQEEPIGRVDWVNGYISGFGIGLAEPGTNQGLARASSLRAAKVDALRNLLKTIHRLHIDPKVRVEDYLISENTTGTRIEGFIKGARLVDQKSQWLDTSPLTIVEMQVCLGTFGKGCANENALNSALDLVALREQLQGPNGKSPRGGIKPPKPLPRESANGPEANGPITGVVFSLGGLPYERVLLPVIAAKDKSGIKTVYSAHFVEPAIVRSIGIVRFADTLDQAKGVKQIGSNYLVVPVDDVDENNRLIISYPSAQQIYASNRDGGDYLREARVVISAE